MIARILAALLGAALAIATWLVSLPESSTPPAPRPAATGVWAS
jgi:hypothetical protein